MSDFNKKLSDISQFGYNLDFTETFNHAFAVYKKIALYAGILILAVGAVFAALAIFVGVFFAGVGSYTSILTGLSSGIMSPVAKVIYILVAAVLAGLISPLYAGIIRMAYDADSNKEISIGDGFQYYKSKHFGALFISAALVSVFTTIFSEIGQVLGLEIILLPVVYIITFFTILSSPLIIFADLNAIDAIKYSFVVVSKNFWVILGLIIVSIICAMIGFIGICIGIIFTIPFVFAMYYSIYVHSVGIDEKSEIDEIGSNFEDRW